MGESPARLGPPKKRRATHFTKPYPYSLHGPRPRIDQTRIGPGLHFIAIEIAVEPGLVLAQQGGREGPGAVWVRPDVPGSNSKSFVIEAGLPVSRLSPHVSARLHSF